MLDYTYSILAFSKKADTTLDALGVLPWQELQSLPAAKSKHYSFVEEEILEKGEEEPSTSELLDRIKNMPPLAKKLANDGFTHFAVITEVQGPHFGLNFHNAVRNLHRRELPLDKQDFAEIYGKVSNMRERYPALEGQVARFWNWVNSQRALVDNGNNSEYEVYLITQEQIHDAHLSFIRAETLTGLFRRWRALPDDHDKD